MCCWSVRACWSSRAPIPWAVEAAIVQLPGAVTCRFDSCFDADEDIRACTELELVVELLEFHFVVVEKVRVRQVVDTIEEAHRLRGTLRVQAARIMRMAGICRSVRL